MVSTSIIRKVLVVGATGATGKNVVRMLLDRGDTSVVTVVRSEGKLKSLLNIGGEKEEPNLAIKEASISELTANDFEEIAKGCDVIISCLGHNLTYKGMYKDGYFVKETVRKVTNGMAASKAVDSGPSPRFILMGSDGVAHPDGKTDPKRTFFERCVLKLLRWLVPPHVDNEMAALYLYQNPSINWSVARPGDLLNIGEEGASGREKLGYDVYDHPQGTLFGGRSTLRSDAAAFMVELAVADPTTWEEKYNHKMPVVYTKEVEEETK